ncbi:hypothetical protein [Actinomadura madurae]|uniref:Tetratricopeptide repeat-containing protein n=1 Tax=Actinomadura madurae TaxID=1993 RepID=A0A1I5TPC7_9ACTN|nr:hypothetical protein [Actinomadura madurae]SFP84893.1 hypothetical protein SAMN04489713_11872 [Actinomadura madurae]SPT51659.1 Uncharacterised protein [Actinomadura madurae]
MDEWDVTQARVALLRGKRLSTVEEVRIYRVLAEVEPGLYLPKLALALRALTYAEELRHKPEARAELAMEALEVAKRIPSGHPERSEVLADALDACRWQLCEAGRHEDAFELHAEIVESSRGTDIPGLHLWAVALAEEGRYAESASVFAELTDPAATPSDHALPWNLISCAAQFEAAGDAEAALARSSDLVELEQANVDHETGPMTCYVYAAVNHARLLGILGRDGDAVAALEAAEPVCAELAATGERKSWSGYQTAFWAVLLSVSSRADERFPQTGPRPPLGVNFHHWAPHVRGWYGEEERAALRDEVEALRPGAEAAPRRHLRELVALHRRLTVRAAVSRDHRAPLPLSALFEEGVVLAERLRPFDGGVALRTALLDRSTFSLAGGDHEGGYADFVKALALMRS